MNRRELEKLIDNEVSRVFDSVNLKEPQPEPNQIQSIQPPKRSTLSQEELDEILFYGGEKPKS